MSRVIKSRSSENLQTSSMSKTRLAQEDPLVYMLQNSSEFKTCTALKDGLSNMSTGFGEGNDLYFESKCAKRKLKTPLYQENYLKEFATEEEKAAARHALGLYNKGDIVAMSLLTAEDSLPNQDAWSNVVLKQMRKGDEFFAPVTSFNAVFDSTGISLNTRINEIQSLIINHQKQLTQITEPTNAATISSLGDVEIFLQGFTNGDNLHNTLDNMNQEMLRFEKIGQIT